jgi:hypothetical protein
MISCILGRNSPGFIQLQGEMILAERIVPSINGFMENPSGEEGDDGNWVSG